MLSGSHENIRFNPLPKVRRLVVGFVFAAIDEAHRRTALEKQQVPVPSGTLHRVLIAVDTHEAWGVGHQVDSLLRPPPLVIAQAFGVTAGQGFGVVGSAEEVHLGGVHRIAIGIENRAIRPTVRFDIGMTMAIAEQQVIRRAANRHRLARTARRGGRRTGQLHIRKLRTRPPGAQKHLADKYGIVQGVGLVSGTVVLGAAVGRIRDGKALGSAKRRKRSKLRSPAAAIRKPFGQRPLVARKLRYEKLVNCHRLGLGPMAKNEVEIVRLIKRDLRKSRVAQHVRREHTA